MKFPALSPLLATVLPFNGVPVKHDVYEFVRNEVERAETPFQAQQACEKIASMCDPRAWGELAYQFSDGMDEDWYDFLSQLAKLAHTCAQMIYFETVPSKVAAATPTVELTLSQGGVAACENALEAIKDWMRANGAASIVASLNAGASEQAIADAERALGLPLPPALASLYRLHDGQGPTLSDRPFMRHDGSFLPLTHALHASAASFVSLLDYDMVGGQQGLQSVGSIPASPERMFPLEAFRTGRKLALKPEECSSAWFKFAEGDGINFAGWVNLRSGRVFSYERDTGLSLAAESFAHYLTEFALSLRNGQYVVRLWEEEEEEEEEDEEIELSADASEYCNMWWERIRR